MFGSPGHVLRALALSLHVVVLGALAGAQASSGPCSSAVIRIAAGEAEDESPAVDPAVVRELLAWVGENSDYDVSGALEDPPRTRFCDTGEILHYEGHDIVVDQAVRAAYDLTERIIYLVRPWDVSDVDHRSSLLHEIVHDLQFAQREWHCSVEPEWEAYKLQDAWLREQGVESGFNWLRIQMLSTCPRDIHP